MTIKACVIGDPIAHSRSPLIHGYWLKCHGINGSYERQHVKPENLAEFIAHLKANGFAGCNVTIPHKETALAYVDVKDDRVRRCGALNTIYLENGKICATTTDGIGFCANVNSHCPDFSFNNARLFIYGAGGSARPIIDEVLRRGAAKVFITNRTIGRAEEIVRHFGSPVQAIAQDEVPKHLGQTDLLINCTSIGMKGEGEIDLDLTLLPKTAVVADIVYVPLVTSFLQRAEELGLRIVPGLGMLLHQAVPGFEKWFGARPEVTKPLHDLIARDIDPSFKSVTLIGLTGSIAMGKSEAARIFMAQGIPVFDADAEVHKLYGEEKGVSLIGAIVPEAVRNNKIDRAVLATHALYNPRLLAELEKQVHAEIRKRRQQFIRSCQGPLAVLDIPLLFETGSEKDVDHTLVISSSPEIQRARALARPGMTEEKLAKILARQMPDEEKRKRAEKVIDNSDDLAALETKIIDYIASVKAGHA